jgi:hypothetical protein
VREIYIFTSKEMHTHMRETELNKEEELEQYEEALKN